LLIDSLLLFLVFIEYALEECVIDFLVLELVLL
jgi:hypothetical protein